ncbi:sensor histidine kinase [Aurantimonas sp. VKM B-3413]|uniref:sensor histidine kinase n=1 Tax=Aurantimonas sp. VKM B-3413 TaxID=2779401 RepID=UPI001E3292CA|nr:sensor histidine kinase [Aurantimonas sp. VKM B-3413]MCB8838835.1 sensor histidine kinase [Aurantimonas sp. VKM B-3413]
MPTRQGIAEGGEAMAFEADAVHAAPGERDEGGRAKIRSATLSRLLRRPPLIAHLVLFALTVLVPALLFSAFLILQFSEQQQQIAAAQVNDTAEIVSNAVDREIYGLITMGRVLAASPAIPNERLDAFQERTAAALRNTQTSAELVDRSMQVVVATQPAQSSVPPTFDDSATIERAFSTMRPVVSGVSFRKESGNFVYHVAVPVVEGSTARYVLALTKAATSFEAVIADRNLPREWSAIIKDSEGHRVFAAVTSGGKMQSRQGISYDNPSIIEAIGSGTRTDLIEASTVSSLSGWTTTVAVPSAVIDGPTYRSWILLFGAGFLLLAFSVALGIIFGRRIAEPILSLAQQAELIGKGLPATTISTDIAEVGQVSKVLAQASRERREAEEQNRFLMREMTHRAKNQYALVAAIARRAAKESSDTNKFLATLSDALASLARSADLLAGRGWQSVDMDDLVAMQLKPFGADTDQIESCGPHTPLNAAAAQTIGLALHELATNAAKYGALSSSEGRVRISWSLGDEFTLVWRESGGPPVIEPKSSGFGTLVTQKMTARGLGGQVDMNYARDGVVWTLTAPSDAIRPQPEHS